MKTVLTGMLVALNSIPAMALEISGPATIQDGDTFCIGAQVIRLYGIDVPKNGQNCEKGGLSLNCGDKAENKLRCLLRNGVTCSAEDENVKFYFSPNQT